MIVSFGNPDELIEIISVPLARAGRGDIIRCHDQAIDNGTAIFAAPISRDKVAEASQKHQQEANSVRF